MLKGSIPSLTKQWAEKRNLPHFFFKKTQSTNKEARKKVFTNSSLLFIAEEQTEGRGQDKNTWENSDLMMSWLWDVKETKLSPLLCKELTLELFQNTKLLWPELEWSFKEPNDLLLKQKKVAGILLEVIEEAPKKACILGLGFNVFSHPQSINATHLMEHNKNLSTKLWERFLDLNHKSFTEKFLK